ncbi:MAG: gliding motility lipoprotein GldD [Marinilabiliales bacterium]
MKRFISIVLLLIFAFACNEDYIPKPMGYFRIDLPEKTYKEYDDICPFSFEYPEYSRIVDYIKDSCWINIYFPRLNANIYLTYKNIKDNLPVYMEETRSLVYKHTIKASAIDEELKIIPENNIYSVIYHIKGNAASNINFFATDSCTHFIRGALYFNNRPNYDSLKPVIDFIEKDIIHMIETLSWKNSVECH